MIEEDRQSEGALEVAGPPTLRGISATGTTTAAWLNKKEDSRRHLALILFSIFAVAVLAPILTACIITLLAPDRQACFTALMPAVLELLSQFIATAFGPLLAFILGFYFSGS